MIDVTISRIDNILSSIPEFQSPMLNKVLTGHNKSWPDGSSIKEILHATWNQHGTVDDLINTISEIKRKFAIETDKRADWLIDEFTSTSDPITKADCLNELTGIRHDQADIYSIFGYIIKEIEKDSSQQSEDVTSIKFPYKEVKYNGRQRKED